MFLFPLAVAAAASLLSIHPSRKAMIPPEHAAWAPREKRFRSVSLNYGTALSAQQPSGLVELGTHGRELAAGSLFHSELLIHKNLT
jgi:hypothetical protein